MTAILAIDPGRTMGVALVHSSTVAPFAYASFVVTLRGCDDLSQLADFTGLRSDTSAIAFESQTGAMVGAMRAGHFNHRNLVIPELVGGLKRLAAEWGVPCIEVPISTAKKQLAGSGRATKQQVKAAAARLWPHRMSEHAADAIAVGVAALRMAATPF